MLEALREAAIKKLGLTDDDAIIPEDTIKKDIQEMSSLFRLVRDGKMPTKPRPANRKLSKETQQEMIAGKRTLARHRSGR